MSSSHAEDSVPTYAMVNMQQKCQNRNRNKQQNSVPSTAYSLSDQRTSIERNTGNAETNISHNMEARYKTLIAAADDGMSVNIQSDQIDGHAEAGANNEVNSKSVTKGKVVNLKLLKLGVILLSLALLVAVLVSISFIAFLFAEISSLKSDIHLIQNNLSAVKIEIFGIVEDLRENFQEVIQNKSSSLLKNLNQTDNKVEVNSNRLDTNNRSIASIRTTSEENSGMVSELSSNLKSTKMSVEHLSSTLDLVRSEHNNLTVFVNKTDSSLTERIDKLNDIKANNEALNSVKNAMSVFSSCSAIFELLNSSTSGYYWLRSADGSSSAKVFCDRMASCGGITGSWIRVAKLNKTDADFQCFKGLKKNEQNQCVKNTSMSGCSSVIFPAGIPYLHICGKILAYGINSPDGFHMPSNINDNYVDGVSLTYGSDSDRHHVWTFAARIDQIKQPWVVDTCNVTVPEFVGKDFTCMRLLNSDTCPTSSCAPEFNRQLQVPTSDNIEMRVCTDQVMSDENIVIDDVEIYIQ